GIIGRSRIRPRLGRQQFPVRARPPAAPMSLPLPESFIQTIINTYPNGRAWLAELPARIEHAARRWGLSDIQPVSNLSYNFVAFARAAGGREVVLKIGPPNRELLSELTALRLFDGNGAARLLDADEAHYAFLLERLRPGAMLADLADDEAATRIAAGVMHSLWREPPPGLPLIPLSAWFDELGGLRPRYGGGTGPFPARLVERVESNLPGLMRDSGPDILMHGDCHHFNILSSERGWLVIDPKGVVGPRGYECGPFLVNPWPGFITRPNAADATRRRIAILSEHLSLPRDLILEWAICHSLLSAWWDLTEDDTGDRYAIACGELFLGLSPASI
ncbi:MAG: aminoglycoside phosphotransferase family protein, partial [Anaerolineales bacterium]